MSPADLSSFFIMLREGLEMALVVGIVLAYLAQTGQGRFTALVWAAVAAAAAVAIGVLFFLQAIGQTFTGATEQIFEGTTMLLAAGFLTWMIFWMLRQARYLSAELRRGVREALAQGAGWALFALVFFAVLREGVESALLLQAAIFAAPGEGGRVGTLIGLAAACGIGVLIYAFGRRIDLPTFFRVTGALLILFAAGLVAHAAHEFAEAGVLSAIEGPKLWSTKAVLPDNDGLGAILRAVFGYQDQPTVLELAAYVAYFAVVFVLSKTKFALPAVARSSQASPTA